MQKQADRIGTGALSLLMVLAVLALTTLGMMAFISARSDLRLSKRALAMTEAYYDATAAGEEHLAKLDSIFAASNDEYRVLLPEWAEWQDKHTIVYYEHVGENLAIQITVQVENQNGRVYCANITKKFVSGKH